MFLLNFFRLNSRCILRFENVIFHSNRLRIISFNSPPFACQLESTFVSSSFSISDIKNALQLNSIEFEDGYTNLLTHCFECNKKSLFINKISGYCLCNLCQKSASWKAFDSDKKTLRLEDDYNIKLGVYTWDRISPLLKSPEDLDRKTLQNILEKCKLECISVELLKSLEVKFSENNAEVYIPLKNGIFNVGCKVITADGEVTFPNSHACGVIGKYSESDCAVVVHSVRDLFALLLYQLRFDVVCLPHGQQKLPQETLPLFEKYNKIILWFGNDPVSWDHVRVFAKKFQEDRCFLIRPLLEQPAPHQAHLEGLNVEKIINSAQPISHSAIITFSKIRDDVLLELQNIEKVTGVKWKRFPALNTLLKGHRRGELTIMTGSTGCGKTTFMSEYSVDLASQGVSTLWGSFEIKNQRLARTMLQQFVNEPLEESLSKFNHWADKFENLPVYFLTFHGQQSLDIVLEAVEHGSYVHDIGHVIIDNVQFMLGLSATEVGFLDRFYRQDALIGAFRNFATKSNCHVTLVIHPRKEKEGELLNANSIFGGAKASQEADNILIMQTKTLNTLKLKKYLQVAKNRFSGDIGIMPLEFDRSTLSFGEKQDKKK